MVSRWGRSSGRKRGLFRKEMEAAGRVWSLLEPSSLCRKASFSSEFPPISTSSLASLFALFNSDKALTVCPCHPKHLPCTNPCHAITALIRYHFYPHCTVEKNKTQG